MNKIELLAPVGDFTTLTAVIEAGADAVYLGIKNLNMRASAKNFSNAELKKAVKIAHENNVKVYVTLNTIIYENEMKKLERALKAIKNSNADAVICWDQAVIAMANKMKIPVHISTQASISNEASLEFYKKHAERFVLARELDLPQIKKIIKNTGADVEIFGHGAMCVSESGRCFISQMLYGCSANRGECIQPCRREYKIIDPETGKELKLKNNYVMSPKDLCSLPFVDLIIKAGVGSLKLEGRTRSPEYAKVVTSCYRRAIDAVYNKTFNDELVEELLKELKTVYNKKFSSGFLIGLPTSDDWTNLYGSAATTKKIELGYVTNFYSKIGVCEVKLIANEVEVEDDIQIQGPTTGVFDMKLKELFQDDKKVKSSVKGKTITFKTNSKIRRNDRVYKIVKVKQRDDYKNKVKKKLESFKV